VSGSVWSLSSCEAEVELETVSWLAARRRSEADDLRSSRLGCSRHETECSSTGERGGVGVGDGKG